MFLRRLILNNYRNYSNLDLEFENNTNLIIGDNAQGKTNLLEAIYFASTGKSHRTNSTEELIKRDSDYAVIRVFIQKEFEKTDIDTHLTEIELRPDNRNKFKIDRAVCRKKSYLNLILPSVIFSPDDLSIIKGSPGKRRDFLDDILEKVNPNYYSLSLHYQKILNQRNSLLKTLNNSGNLRNNPTLDTWDENLIRYGSEIIYERNMLLSEIRKGYPEMIKHFFSNIYTGVFYNLSWERRFAGFNDDLSSGVTRQETADNGVRGRNELYYNGLLLNSDSSSESSLYDGMGHDISFKIQEMPKHQAIEYIEGQFRFNLKNSLNRELNYKTTIIGPHRDDFSIRFNDMDVRSFGSQGQQRVAAISLKLCELYVIKNKLKKTPVLLLDDVLSELDMQRERTVLEIIDNKFQTFITTSNLNYIDNLANQSRFLAKRYIIRDNKSFKICE